MAIIIIGLVSLIFFAGMIIGLALMLRKQWERMDGLPADAQMEHPLQRIVDRVFGPIDVPKNR